jgi:hypothetical protein
MIYRRRAHRSYPRADKRVGPELMAVVLQGRSVIWMDVKAGNSFGQKSRKSLVDTIIVIGFC